MNKKSTLKEIANDYLTHPRCKKGITLVALVVTIIVLIILAGVSISLVLGQNGILTRAREGRNNYQLAANEEAVALGGLDTEVEKYVTGRTPEETEKYGLRADGKFYCDPSSTVAKAGGGSRSQIGLIYESSHFYSEENKEVGYDETTDDYIYGTVYYVCDEDMHWFTDFYCDVFDSSGKFLYAGQYSAKVGKIFPL